MTNIRFDGVAKSFGGVKVVEKLDLEIAGREFFTFVGSSGCGKSTILNMIAGLEDVTAGEIFFDDRPVTHLPPGQRDVAMVFQSYALYPHMTVHENIAFPLRVRKTPKKEVDREVLKAAESLGLSKLLSRKPSELSGGQRQRVALGRAIVRKPKVFLMDEPLSNLDARLRVEMRTELKRIHERLGITTVYVTHDQEEAMSLSGRIAILAEGRIQQLGGPMELYERPSNLFVAGFIGSPPMNFIGGENLRDTSLAAALPRGEDGEKVIAGIRPQDVAVRAAGAEPALEAEVIMLEPVGSDVWVDGVWKEAKIKGRLAAGETVKPGSAARFEVPPEKLRLFDKETGRRVF
ncbi:MAG: ABC transporter ATP-binding protein [Candidatus Nitrospinota bacterium M3_3B_026]